MGAEDIVIRGVNQSPNAAASVRSLNGSVAPPAAARSRFALILAALFMIGFLVPIDIVLGSLRLTPYRLVALAALIPCVFIVVSGRAGGIRTADMLMVSHAGFAVLALLINHGLDEVEYAGMYVIETLGPYVLARCAIRTAADFKTIVLIALAMVIVILPFTLFETVTGKHVLRTAFGQAVPFIPGRMGLERAFGPFEHPILYGNFAASCLGIVFYGVGRHGSRAMPLLLAAVIFVATFVSLSSGPVSTFAFQTFLILWDKATVRIPNRWWLLFGLFAAAYITVDVLSNRNPFHVFVSYLTFNSESAYARFIIYESGFAEVLRHPLFGIGNHTFVVPIYGFNSVDAFWLLQTMRYGVPASLCFIGAFLAMGFAVGRRVLPPEIARYRKGWLITIVGLALSGISVHYWGPVYCWYMFLLGSGAWMLAWPAGRAVAAKSADNAKSDARPDEGTGGEQMPVAAEPASTTSPGPGAPARFCRPEETRWVRSDD